MMFSICFATFYNKIFLFILSNLINEKKVDELAADLMDNDISTRVDKSSASLGRRYARAGK
jgi:hypothetical protein